MSPTCYICGTGTTVCDECRKRYFPVWDRATPAVVPRTSGVCLPPIDADESVECEVLVAQDWDVSGGRYSHDEDDRITEVEKQGFVVFRADDHTLLLDLDTQDGVQQV
jgi:hypothetical protein